MVFRLSRFMSWTLWVSSLRVQRNINQVCPLGLVGQMGRSEELYLSVDSNVATSGRWSEPRPQFGIVGMYVSFVTHSRAMPGLSMM